MRNEEQIEKIQNTILNKIERAIQAINNLSIPENDKNTAEAVERLVNAYARLGW